MFVYHLLISTWNPKNPYFEWKGPSFGGFKAKNRQTGSRYNIDHFLTSLIFQPCPNHSPILSPCHRLTLRAAVEKKGDFVKVGGAWLATKTREDVARLQVFLKTTSAAKKEVCPLKSIIVGEKILV